MRYALCAVANFSPLKMANMAKLLTSLSTSLRTKEATSAFLMPMSN